MRKLNIYEILDKFKDTHGDKFDYSNFIEYIGDSQKIRIVCKNCNNIFVQSINHHKKGVGCPTCATEKQKILYSHTNTQFIEKSIKIHGNKYDYSLIEYKNNKIKVKIICPIHGIFEQTPVSHYKHGCRKCDNDRKSIPKITNNIFIKRSNDIHNNEYDYRLVDYKNSSTKVKIICNVHGEFTQTPNSHLSGRGCQKCAYEKNGENLALNTDIFIHNANKIHNISYDYSNVVYTRINKKVNILCNKCGLYFTQTPLHHLSGEGCPKCRSSKGEKKIRIYLIENNIQYIEQKIYENCKFKLNLPFDFYLPDYNMCIEFDGEQHFKVVDFWGGENGFKNIKIRDKIKTDFCKNNNISLLRIKYTEIKDVEDILLKKNKLI